MNKEQYRQLLMLRKSEEELFWHLLRVTGKTPREMIDELPIHRKRMLYILQKWIRQKRYCSGTELDLGSLTFDRLVDYEKRDLWFMKVFKVNESEDFEEFKKYWESIMLG